MKLITPGGPNAARGLLALAHGRRAKPRAVLAAVVLCVAAITGTALAMPSHAATGAAGAVVNQQDRPVGHQILIIDPPRGVPGRHVAVHLWYPADPRGFSAAPKTVYTSALNGRALPQGYRPLSWVLTGGTARENVPVDPRGPAFPVIVFSHGNLNDPIDYAYTLEQIARAGFVVAAPSHTGNSQDDVRIDYLVSTLGPLANWTCNDSLPPPCSRTDIPVSMKDRVADVSAVLDNLPEWLGDRVDLSEVGVMGHSRGTVTALAAAGGSALWNIKPVGQVLDQAKFKVKVKGVMGLAIGSPSITSGVDLQQVTVPTLLVAGDQDRTSPMAVSQFAIDKISSKDKALVIINGAVHRSFDSTYCDQTQAAGAIAQGNEHAILDRQTISQIVTAFPLSGRPMDYCSFDTFTSPVDIRDEINVLIDPDFNITPQTVPATGLDSDTVKDRVVGLATDFFGRVLK
ncbi:alpha/beta hydrolase family protein [Intrasporangium mesophilum]